MKTLKITQKIEVPLPYAYYAFSNKSGWVEWFSHKAYGHAKKGALLRLYYEPEGDFAFYFTDQETEQWISFDFIDLEKWQTSKVKVRFELEEEVVTVSLEHTGIPTEKYAELKEIWETSFANLKSVLETGKDLRLWNRPFLGVTVQDWVTAELAEQQGLPIEFGMQLSSVISGRGAEEAGLVKGDIISTISGEQLHSYKIYLDFLATVKAGDVVDISYYRGEEKHDIKVKLSSYPTAEPPATAQDYAEKIENFQKSVIKKIKTIFEDYNEAQFEFRPGPGEWSAKETLGHIVAFESDAHTWVSTLVGGCEEYPCPASHPLRIKSLLLVYPAIDQLMEELIRRQKETTAMLIELPAEFVTRTGSFARLANVLNLDYSKHYKEHLAQIEDSLKKAENVRAR